MPAIRIFLVLLIAFSFPSNSYADSDDKLDPAVLDALNKVQDMLKDPAKVSETAAGLPGGTEALGQVKSLAGSAENENAIMQLAAEIFGNIVKDAHGDPNAVEKALEAAKSNPAAFASKLTPEEQKRLSEIAAKITKGKATP